MQFYFLLLLLFCDRVYAVVVSTGQCPAYTATNTQGAVQNYVNCQILVLPGDVLHISTCNIYDGDTYLRLFDPSNSTELIEGDDGCGGKGGTDFTYVVPIAYPNEGVNLNLRQGCFSFFTCGATVEYSLNVEANPVPYPTSAPGDDDRVFNPRSCPVEECMDANHPEKGWNRCDMCVCEDFDKIFLSDHDHDCNADEKYYMCMVKYNVKSVTCTTEMKPGWIAAFFFIGLCGFIFFAGAFGYIIYLMCFAHPNKPVHPVMIAVAAKNDSSSPDIHDDQDRDGLHIESGEPVLLEDPNTNDPVIVTSSPVVSEEKVIEGLHVESERPIGKQEVIAEGQEIHEEDVEEDPAVLKERAFFENSNP